MSALLALVLLPLAARAAELGAAPQAAPAPANVPLTLELLPQPDPEEPPLVPGQDLFFEGDRPLPKPDAPPAPVNDKKNLKKLSLKTAKTTWFKPYLLKNPRGGVGPMRREGRTMVDRKLIQKLEGKWQDGKGIRFRLNYLNPVAFSVADKGGMTYKEPGKFMTNSGEKLPEEYWGQYAIYHHGQTVEYEIEVENTGKKTLKDVRIMAAQEVFSRQGGQGKVLPDQVRELALSPIEAGKKAVAKNSFKVTSDWTYHGSLEQTHIKIAAGAAAVAAATPAQVLADVYQAGIIDPPPDE